MPFAVIHWEVIVVIVKMDLKEMGSHALVRTRNSFSLVGKGTGLEIPETHPNKLVFYVTLSHLAGFHQS